MSYNCEVCGGHVRAGITRRTFVLLREVPTTGKFGSLSSPRAGNPDSVLVRATRTEIVRELAVCGACHVLLAGGTPMHVVRRQGRERQTQAGTLKPQPPVLLPASVPLEVALSVPNVPVVRRVTFKPGKTGHKGGA